MSIEQAEFGKWHGIGNFPIPIQRGKVEAAQASDLLRLAASKLSPF